MKKLVISMVAVVSAIIMCFALAGCSKDVKGNTYVFDDVKIEGTIPDEAKDYIDQMVEGLKSGYASASIKFNKDGTCVSSFGGEEATGYYKQDGKKVYLGETEDFNTDDAESSFEVNGSKLEMTMEEGGLKITIVLKKK
ncbi:MAG: hypothetical protein K2O41_04790 [Clostridia bacterium]|nr:hypothetical protein [Clostridia bacterium]